MTDVPMAMWRRVDERYRDDCYSGIDVFYYNDISVYLFAVEYLSATMMHATRNHDAWYQNCMLHRCVNVLMHDRGRDFGNMMYGGMMQWDLQHARSH